MTLKAAALCLAAAAAYSQTAPVPQQIAAHLTANALKADVSFLASDALEGRGTPSPGLDIAAEYIAAQFRRAGLEPAGDDAYFQTAPFFTVTPNLDGLQLTLDLGGTVLQADRSSMGLQQGAALNLAGAPIFKAVLSNSAALNALTADQVRGKVLVLEIPDSAGGGRGALAVTRRVPAAAARLQPALVVILRATGQGVTANPRLSEVATTPPVPILSVWDTPMRTALAAARPGPVEGTLSAHIAAPAVAPVKLRNVIGVLRGSDPALKDTYVLITAHYDHLGIRGTGPGDHIFNGANDDASGTASVIEIAGALSALPARPKRSVVFIAFFGEELGLVGSRYYAQHPVFPLAKTVADLNLEQLGRTDDVTGPRVAQFNVTGFDYTNLPDTLAKAAAEFGVQVVKDEQASDVYFARSDNQALADAGVPAHTLSVGYEFPDYHGAGDEWPKLDYDNLAKIDRVIALGILRVADNPEPPAWNAANPKTERYRR